MIRVIRNTVLPGIKDIPLKNTKRLSESMGLRLSIEEHLNLSGNYSLVSRNIGRSAESFACGFLKRTGFKLLARNYATQAGEVDIVAEEKGVLCFIEVKMRHSGYFGLPQEYVTHKKQKKISLVASEYITSRGFKDPPVRFDVISIIQEGGRKKIQLIRDAF